LVLTACQGSHPESASALETICRLYWYPLYAYARQSGQSPSDAQDVTQEFFRLFLEKNWLRDVDRNRGRLRSFLITALKRFMANEWRRVTAQKRGHSQPHFSIDTAFAESRYASQSGDQFAADEIFDREWALKLLELTLERLESEFQLSGKAADFFVLKDFLAVSHANIDYDRAAGRLGQSEGATRVAVHRLRKRFRELYREEVAQTLPKGEDLEAELRYLAGVLVRA